MNSLASILYSSPSMDAKNRKNLSLQPISKTTSNKQSRCQAGMLLRSSTPKTPLQSKTKTTIAAHPMTLPSYSSSVHFSANSPRSPRCSTPLFAKQRRTRPFIVCELCRQRAFQSLNYEQNKNRHNQIIKRNENQSTTHSHSTTLQYQTHTSSRRRRRDRRCSSIDQLLVWII